MKIIKLSIVAIFLCIHSQGNAQAIILKHSFNVDLGLPNAVGNRPFRRIMQGLLNAGLAYQYTLPNSLAFGAGARYSYFNVNEFKVKDSISGGLHSVGAYIKVGHEKFHTERFGTDMGVKFGYTYNMFPTNVNRKNGINPQVTTGVYLEPNIGLVLTADEQTSYRLNIGYAFHGFGFNPKSTLGSTQNEGYDPAEFNKITHYFIIGFGFTYYFKPKA